MTDDIPNTKGAWLLVAIAAALCLLSCLQVAMWTPEPIDYGVHETLVEQIQESREKNQVQITNYPTTRSTNVNKDYILRLIVQTFPPSEWQNAADIVQCESGFNLYAHGDVDLISYDEKWGEEVGDSIGIFQIRTGGKNRGGGHWNRARANGMTAMEFTSYLFVPENNVAYAYEIWKRSGWQPWSCSGTK